MNYKEATEFLLELPDMERTSHGSKARTMSLDAVRALLQRLDNPHLHRKTAHVTGSKGKGSTSAMLASILAANCSTSLYSSPHLHSYRERICLDLHSVSSDDFASGVEEIKDTVLAVHEGDLGPTSTFGAMCALFFCLNRRHHVQWQIVEVGMGGTYDATNVFDSKELVIITAVSLEHTNVLGKTTLEIAQNKAGIIRPGAAVVLAPQKDPQVSELITRLCKEQGACFVDVGREYAIQQGAFDSVSQTFTLSPTNHATIPGLKDREFKLKMLGKHQLDNAATAIAASDLLRELKLYDCSDRQVKESIEDVFVPGRFELLRESPRVLIDGAHNGESMEALVSGVRRHFGTDSLTFVLGVNLDKDINQILEAIKPACKTLIATRSVSQKAMDPGLVHTRAQELGINSQIADSSDDALKLAMKQTGESGFVCATGSLYLVAEVREHFLGENPPWSLASSTLKSSS